MPHFSNPNAPIRFGLTKNIRRLTNAVRKNWSPADLDERRREAITAQKQLAFLAAFEAR
jgi:hypothetical protein